MSITAMKGGGTLVCGADSVAMYRLLALKAMLRMESVGLKRRGTSALSIVKAEFGFKGNAVKVLAQLETYIERLQTQTLVSE